MQPWQAGGVKSLDTEIFMVAAEVDFGPERFPYGAALDYRKAFDSLDWPLAIVALRGLKVPDSILNLLRHQWANQVRWVTFSGVVCPEAIYGCAGLPQGDPWSPVALAAVLACPLQAANASTDKVKNLLYLDYRTLLAADEPSLRTALAVWAEFEGVSRMRTHEGKTQLFCRLATSSDTAEVLGATLGQSSRPLSAKELRRRKQAEYIAQRIGLLPVTLKFRATLAAVVYSPKASWGSFRNCRRPTKQDFSRFTEVFRSAVKGAEAKGDRSCRDLQKLLLLGHSADLALLSAQRLLKAAARWARYHIEKLGQRPPLESLTSSRLFQVLSVGLPAGWQVGPGPGECSCAATTWDILSPAPAQDRAAHELRDGWRLALLHSWLAADRNDSRAARAEGLQIDEPLLKRLRSWARQTSRHGVSIMCGGFSPDAVWTPAGGVRGFCHSCSQAISPHTRHVMWECPAHDALRFVAMPVSGLAQRLGWSGQVEGAGVVLKRLGVMADIRRADVRGRGSRPPWVDGGVG